MQVEEEAAANARHRPSDGLAAMPRHGRRHVLLVGDQAATLEHVSRLLAPDAWRGPLISTASSRAEAMRMLGRDYPDVVVVLNSLRDGRGRDLVRAIASAENGVPLVLIDDDGTCDPQSARDAGATDRLAVAELTVPVIGRAVRQAAESGATRRRLDRLGDSDPLTGLASRDRLQAKLHDAVATARRTERLLAVLFIDLDDFRRINEAVGHQGGDAVLREVARRLSACCRQTDTLARLDGDTFAVAAGHIEYLDGVTVLAGRITAALARPFEAGGQTFHCTASIGITTHPHDSGGVDRLLDNAEVALRRAKADGRDRWCFFGAERNALVSGQAI